MNDPLGRLNRARISRERYVAGPSEIDPPSYRSSIYDGALSPSPTTAPRVKQIEAYPRSTEQSFSRLSLGGSPQSPARFVTARAAANARELQGIAPEPRSMSSFVAACTAPSDSPRLNRSSVAGQSSMLLEEYSAVEDRSRPLSTRHQQQQRKFLDESSFERFAPSSSNKRGGELDFDDHSFVRRLQEDEMSARKLAEERALKRKQMEDEIEALRRIQMETEAARRKNMEAEAALLQQMAEEAESLRRAKMEEEIELARLRQLEEEVIKQKALLAEQNRRRSHDYRFRARNASSDEWTAASSSPVITGSKELSSAGIQQAKRKQDEAILNAQTTDVAQVRKEIDRLVVEALNLQDQGQFEEAHFLLLKVERLRIEIELEESKQQQQHQQQQQQPPQQTTSSSHIPRRASLVLEEARKAQTTSSLQPSMKGDDEDYREDEFDSLSEEEDHFQAAAISVPPVKRHSLLSSSSIPTTTETTTMMTTTTTPTAKHAIISASKDIVVGTLGETGAESLIQELSKAVAERSFNGDVKDTTHRQQPQQPEEKTAEALTSVITTTTTTTEVEEPKAVVVIPAAHVEASALEEERERRKRELRKRREEQAKIAAATAEPPPSVSVDNVAKASVPPSTMGGKHEENDSKINESVISSVESVASPSASKRSMATGEDDNDQGGAFKSTPSGAIGELALVFADASFEPLEVDKSEASKTLDELELARRRREQLNPTKSSRLPGLNEESFRLFNITPGGGKKEEEQYTSKEGYLVKLVEAPRFAMLSSSFHKRYFVLSGGVLLHLKNEQGSVPRGMISLENASVRLMQCNGVQNGFCVVVESPQRNYTLFPRDRREAVEWAVAIEHNAAVVSRLKYEEAKRVKQLVRKKLSMSGKANSSNMLSDDVVEALIGKDVSADDFVDVTQLAIASPTTSSDQDHSKNDETVAVAIGGYYDLLGVAPNATTEVIRKAYHKLAKTFHPDKNTSIDAKRFALINRAFHVIQDPETRERYNLGERVKHALRRGVLAQVHLSTGESYPAAVYIGPTFTVLYWQDAEFGSELKRGFKYAELRFVQEVIAGEDDGDWPWARTEEAGKRCLSILGQRLGHPHVRLELDTEESRDEILDGLRILRCEQSMLFVQKLEEWLKGGNHR